MNIKHPTIVIINGANWIGSKLVELMLEQKGNVIVVDDFSEKNMPFIKRHSDSKHFVFIEKDKVATLRDNFTEIKYIIHLKNDFDTSDDKISSKYFLSETRFIDEILTISLEKNSSYILTSSIHLHKDFLLKKNYLRESDQSAYTESDLQDYLERTVLEYEKKAGLNARLVRLGNVYGPEMDLDLDPLLKQILTDAFYRDDIRIYGDGLEYMYYVYISDAIQGILKALFTPQTKGKVYAITNPDEVSVLTIVNKILALQPNAQRIKFIKSRGGVDPLYEKAYIPDENLSEIGWKPNVSFDRGIAQVLDYFRKDSSLHDSNSDAISDSADNDAAINDSIKFHFDDTINLAGRFFGPNVEEENEQFREFYRKLNSSDSPIFNNSKKRTPMKQATSSTKEAPQPKIAKPRTKADYIRYVLYCFVFLVVYIFFIVPVFRFGLLFWKIKSVSGRLDYYISNNYKGAPDSGNLEAEVRKDFAGVRWAVDLFNQDSLETNLTSVARGLDSASKAKQEIDKNNLYGFMQPNQKIPESAVTQIQDVLLLLSSSRTQLASADSISLPFGSSEKAIKVRSWAYDTEKSFAEKIKANSTQQ